MKAQGYCRVSKESQAISGLGLAGQREIIERTCRERGWELVGIEEDAGVSGSREKRPALDRVLTTMKAGDADVLISAKMDRISRSLVHFASLMQISAKQGWSIVAVDVGVDSSSATGRMVAGVLSVFASFELERISSRIREAMAVKRARGDKMGSERIVSLDTVRQVAALYEQHQSWRKTAIALNDAGIPTPKGGPWFPASARAVVQRHLPATTAASAA